MIKHRHDYYIKFTTLLKQFYEMKAILLKKISFMVRTMA